MKQVLTMDSEFLLKFELTPEGRGRSAGKMSSYIKATLQCRLPHHPHLHSVRRSLKTQCRLFLLDHCFPLESGAADWTTRVKVRITSWLFKNEILSFFKWTKTPHSCSYRRGFCMPSTLFWGGGVFNWLEKFAGVSLLGGRMPSVCE